MLKKWADENLMKFSKVKCSVLHLGRNNPACQYMLGANRLESSFAESGFGVLVDNKLTKSVPSWQKRLTVSWDVSGGALPVVEEGVLIYSALVRLHPGLPSIRDRLTGLSPAQCHKDD